MQPHRDDPDGKTSSEEDEISPLTSDDEDEISLLTSDDEEEIICTHLTTSLNPPKAGNSSKHPKDESPSSSKKGEAETNKDDNTNEGLEHAKTALATAGVATGSAVVGTAAATAGLTAVGFTGAGVAAGSVAAGVQASIGSVAAGSAFAGLQAIGATGGFAVLGPVGIAAGAIGGGIFLGVKIYKSVKGKKKNQGPSKLDGMKPEDNENSGTEEKLKSDETPLVRGVNICDECWRRMQIREYEKFAKRNEKDKPSKR